jgi:hypothetical protein
VRLELGAAPPATGGAFPTMRRALGQLRRGARQRERQQEERQGGKNYL